MNACLRILALDLFPDCDISYLRELILGFRYAHIEQVVDTLLSAGKWPERLDYGKLDPSQEIRSERYKSQAQIQLIQDFPQVKNIVTFVILYKKKILNSFSCRYGNHRFELYWQKIIGITFFRMIN